VRLHRQIARLMVCPDISAGPVPCPFWVPLASAIPTDLRCEGLVNPLGIDAAEPRLSGGWNR